MYVYKELINNLQPNKLTTRNKSSTKQYEDPKLSKMKSKMEYHKNQQQSRRNILQNGSKLQKTKKYQRRLSPFKIKYDVIGNVNLFGKSKRYKNLLP